MISLNLPTFQIKTTHRNGRTQIYDFLRRRYVTLTPEEWVRQHFTHFLVDHLGYPAALLGNEVTIDVGGVARRCDTVLYRREGGTPRLIVEYKAPDIPISERVFNQISAYNSVLRADYLIVSNGVEHYCCHLDYVHRTAEFLPGIPRHAELK
ncbi:MAG: type I restriction enzyme HsdR N-terminal domain-containing protein [Bacteroidales bacterium]|nr:type I restriction enzyme HsdR N-terminal domain-containing protein [Bacteroidales bacterium]